MTWPAGKAVLGHVFYWPAACLAAVIWVTSVGCISPQRSPVAVESLGGTATPAATELVLPHSTAVKRLPAVDAVRTTAGVDKNVQLASTTELELPRLALQPAALQQPPEILPPLAATEPSVELPVRVPFEAQSMPIDLPTALALTTGQNPQVAFAQQRIAEAFAQLQAAQVLWVPSLRTGMNYNKHEGAIQDVAGNMIETSRGSIYSGFGAQAVGASSPAVPGLLMSFQMRDAIYQPRISEQLLAASRQASRATTNDMLLETAMAYNDLLEARQIEAVAKNTVANARKLADVTGEFARVGEGLNSDADRAKAELASREIDALRTLEAVQVASVRLARVLSQDPSIQLVPQEPVIVPIDLAPVGAGLPELIVTGLSNRPELAQSRLLVGAAVERLRSEVNAPLIPSVLLGLSYGGNGGGLGSDITNYNDRLDFDAVAYWELRNLGWGERAARNEARSRMEQARWQEVRVLDQVASDVAEAFAQVNSRRAQIDVAKAGITAATESYRRNIERTENAEGLPIEALQAIDALDGAQREYVRSVAAYNRAQFTLQRSLGWPVQ